MSLDMVRLRRQLAERRAVQEEHEPGCTCGEHRNELLAKWDDSRDAFELWLYASKDGDVELTAQCRKLLERFAVSIVMVLPEGDRAAAQNRTARWMREAEGK